MPHYDYQCQNCQHKIENVFQKITEEPLKKCPHCQKPSLRRGPGGGIGLHFQGSGFYVNDYDSKPKPDSSSPGCSCGKSHTCG